MGQNTEQKHDFRTKLEYCLSYFVNTIFFCIREGNITVASLEVQGLMVRDQQRPRATARFT